jgi:hypothetical protein
MKLTDKSPEELLEIVRAGRAASDELNVRYRANADLVHTRIDAVLVGDNELAFKDNELVYAARQRCQCGAGFAYPENIGVGGSWHCSKILLGKAVEGSRHDGPMPFMFWDIKSEIETSATGATTRPIKVEA